MFENLYAEMGRNRFGYKELARIMHVRPPTVATRLSGMSDFKLSELKRLAKHFNCSIDYLVEDKESGKSEQNFSERQFDERP